MTCTTLKSFPGGLRMYIDPAASFEDVLEDVEKKFSDSKSFFGNASVVMDFTGKELSESEQLQLANVIEHCCELQIMSISSNGTTIGLHDEIKDFRETLEELDDFRPEMTVRNRSLKPGELLESPCSIMIIGDVPEGACITSTGDIVICGVLSGKAVAGKGTDSVGYVIASEMTPSCIQIGSTKETNPVIPKAVFGKKKCKAVYAKNGKLVFCTLKELERHV